MGQKHKRFREFRTPFPLRDIRENPRSNVRACAAGDGAICSKNRKIVPYHGANPNTRNDARLRSPSPIMAPACDLFPLVNRILCKMHRIQTTFLEDCAVRNLKIYSRFPYHCLFFLLKQFTKFLINN